jgi:hypothetical protein
MTITTYYKINCIGDLMYLLVEMISLFEEIHDILKWVIQDKKGKIISKSILR